MTRWYIRRGEQTRGPFTEPEVFELIGKHQVARGDLLGSDGGGQWWPVETVPIFAQSFAPAEPPPVPPPWFHNTAIVVASLFCCWPIGLVLLWQHPRAPKWVKVAATAWIVFSILFGLGAAISAVVD